MGVAAAFGAPVGGLLFSLEEAASFWSKQLTWRTFVGNLIAAVIGKLTKSGFQKLNTSGFIEFPDNNASFEIWELVTFLFVGLACGLMGALFCALVQRMLRFRRRKFRLGSPTVSSKRARMVEVICVVIFSMTICFWPAVIMGCSDLPNDGSGRVLGESTVAYEPVISGGICSEDSYSSLAYLLLQPKEAAIKTLFSKSMASGAVLSTSNLLICYCIIFGTTIFTFGSAMPVGLFIPNILAGACLGRAAGQILLDLGFDVHAGVYALMGAAGALAGFSRMTVSLAVIFLEITNNVYMCLPLMLVIYTSKALADQFVPGVYHIVLDSNPEVHLLEDNLSEDHILVLKPLMVHDVCTAEVVVLQEYHTVEQIAAVLLRTSFSTYPILDSRGRVLGTTSRVRLATLLMRMRFNESNKAIFSVLEIADPSPEMTLWSTSVDRAFRHFTSSGLTSLMVVSEQHHLLGILTRTDLARLCHEGEHGVEEVRAILERKKLAVEADQIVRCSRSREFHQRGEQSSPTNSEVSSAWESEMDNSSSNEGSSPGSRHDVGF
jgi:chloride channel 7